MYSLEPQFGPNGFRRLMEHGVWFPDCRHLAVSFPASTVATLATGTWPSQHGLVADYWYERNSAVVRQAGANNLLAPTLAAQVAATANNRSYVISLDRGLGAIYAGSNQVRQFWLEPDGRFATNGAPPDWLDDYSALHPIEDLHDAPWQAVGARPGAPPLRRLTYSAEKPAEFSALFKASPFADEAQFDFLLELAARERLGQRDGVDFVCLLASASALLGYETGVPSPLQEQMALRLDERLANTLARLGRIPGENAFAMVVAGAHGAPRLPSPEARPLMAINGETLAQAIDRGISHLGGKVAHYVYPFLYLETAPGKDPQAVRSAAARVALEQPQVAACFHPNAAPDAGEWSRHFRNSFQAARSGDLMLAYRPGVVEEAGGGRGVSYGSVYNYDTRVPLLFYGPPFGVGLVDSPVESVDLAATLARAMAVPQPAMAVGKALPEAFARHDA